MQPYFFPYLGYFQLLARVDKVVFLDDVNFINGGWIHRNRINSGGEDAFVTVPLVGKSQNRLISEIPVSPDTKWRKRIIRTLEQTYHRAPKRDDVLNLFSEVIERNYGSIADLNIAAITRCLTYCGSQLDFTRSSLVETRSVRGAERIKAICKAVGASTYVNPPGGTALYDRDDFAKDGLNLRFLEPVLAPYAHVSRWLPGLSVIDSLMHLDPAQLQHHIHLGTLK